MRVFRIETEDGTGPYNTGSYKLHAIASDRARHPMPEADSKLCNIWSGMSSWDRDEHFFGFKDEDQFRAWFHDDEMLDLMDSLGLGMVEYEVDPEFVHVGNAQLIFKRDYATPVTFTSLLSYKC